MIGWSGSDIRLWGITSERSRLGVLSSISELGAMEDGMTKTCDESAQPLES